MIAGDHPDPSTLDLAQLDAALIALQRQYHHASVTVARADDMPADVTERWRAAFQRRIELIRAEPPGRLYVTHVDPMEPSRERLRKPGPPR
jgi:hypothetical protein